MYCLCTGPLQDPQEAAFRSQVAKMMGDLGTSGDAPFGGEVALDAESQVGRFGGGLVGGWAATSQQLLLVAMLRAAAAVAGHRTGDSCAAADPISPLLNTCPTTSPAAPLRPPQVYWWHDKYRPRCPKYFNRVHTGYDWNKYNQTHYDGDNPPPKTVVVRTRWLWCCSGDGRIWWGWGRAGIQVPPPCPLLTLLLLPISCPYAPSSLQGCKFNVPQLSALLTLLLLPTSCPYAPPLPAGLQVQRVLSGAAGQDCGPHIQGGAGPLLPRR